MTPEGSVSFDRAASFYDATRVLPGDTLDRACDALIAELPPGRVLEIGIGTGRIALPVVARGRDVIGIDISMQMLAKLREKAAAGVHVAAADATALPFADDAFAGAYAVHVLHLIPRWEDAVRELVRVVRPGGSLVIDPGPDPKRPVPGAEIARDIEQRFLAEAGIEKHHPGIRGTAGLDALLAERGAVLRELEPVRGTHRIPPSLIIDLLDNGVFSYTWSLDAGRRHAAAEAVRTWAAGRFGDLSQPVDFPVVVAMRTYRLPS